MAENSRETLERSFASLNVGSTSSPDISLFVDDDALNDDSELDTLRAPTIHDSPAAQVPCTTAPRGFRHSKRYFMNHPKRGIAVIISNKSFDEGLNLDVREGTELDAAILDKAFKLLGFHVKHYKDKTTREMQDIINRHASLDHTDSDCFAAAILTHGKLDKHQEYLFGTNGKMKLEDMLKPFRGDKCLSLVGKPKIFIIQACRGRERDSGVDVDMVESDGGYEVSDASRWPVEADFLIAHSTAPGYESWRTPGEGSWFIQKLGWQIDLHYGFFPGDPETKEGKEFHLLLIGVNSDVAHGCESFGLTDECDGKKQVPSIRSQLTKELYFPVKAPVAPKNEEGLSEISSSAA